MKMAAKGSWWIIRIDGVGYALLAEALGTANMDFIDGLIRPIGPSGFSRHD